MHPPAPLIPSLFDYPLSEPTDSSAIISRQDAESLFHHFRQHPLFRWHDSNNGCEARADALSVVLESWGIPHYKAWVFSGLYLKNHIGGLKQNWNYHVAVALQVMEDGILKWYIVDPSTSSVLQLLQEWADNITDYPHSYHFIRLPHWYIFNETKVLPYNWYARNPQNRKWMIQGLAGINGLASSGKARLVFNKGRIRNTAQKLGRLQSVPHIIASSEGPIS